MTTITAYKSDDGTLHEKREAALEADLEHWKKRALVAEPYKLRADEKSAREPSYSGGHQ